MASSVQKRLEEFHKIISKELDGCIEFWLKNSHDQEYGGFFQCLDANGDVYDTSKMTWMLCRQVWMYTRLYLEVPRYHKPEMLQHTKKGAEFIMKHIKMPNSQKCYILLTREGKPIKSQRSIFSEVFYVMAMAELFRATKEEIYKNEALVMLEQIIYWVRVDSSGLGENIPPPVATSSLAVPMMVLCVIDIIETMEPALKDKYADVVDWAIAETKKHVKKDGSAVLETVSEDGTEIEGSQGRLANPGHAIEAGWFLLQRSMKTQDKELQKLAIDTFMMKSFDIGWDKEHGGIFYFVDLEGKPPMDLNWDMKLYWPHNEAMIAFLMAYKVTKNKVYLEKFTQVFDYSFKHFPDVNGEWFGYLNREGKVKIQAKGGHWKGCFHVPRCLMMCEQMLQEMLQQE